MTRLRLLFALTLALLLAAAPLSALAQESDDDAGTGLILRADGPVHVAAGERIGAAIAISGDATVDGTVDGLLLVIDGKAIVNGRVEGDVTVINGELLLNDTAVVDNVSLINSEFTRAPGATVLEGVHESSGFSFGWGAAVFSALFWVGSSLALLVVGLVLAAIAGKQVTGAGRLATERVGQTVLSSVIVWIGLPLVAVAAFISLIGIPVGLGIGVALLALGFFGYIVAGVRIGQFLTERGRPESRQHPFLAAVVGLVILQLVALLPFIGGFIAGVAGLYGGGALAYYAYQGWRGGHEPAAPLPSGRLTPVPAA